jgi:hypothetical protein
MVLQYKNPTGAGRSKPNKCPNQSHEYGLYKNAGMFVSRYELVFNDASFHKSGPSSVNNQNILLAPRPPSGCYLVVIFSFKKKSIENGKICRTIRRYQCDYIVSTCMAVAHRNVTCNEKIFY